AAVLGVPDTATLTLRDSAGTGPAGLLNISSDIRTAIGGGPGEDAGAVIVESGEISIYSGGTGIGGGIDGDGGDVTINGGQISIRVHGGGAAIGGGPGGAGGVLTVTDGRLQVALDDSQGFGGGYGQATSALIGGGLGVGTAPGGAGGVVVITGGRVDAQLTSRLGRHSGAAIGGGGSQTGMGGAGAAVTISAAATVNATLNTRRTGGSQVGSGAAIGGGGGVTGGDGGTLEISGGTVNATTTGIHGGGAAIGGAGGLTSGGSGGSVTITGGIVTATSADGAGIGGGSMGGAGGIVAISGGEVVATGGRAAAGIGGGFGGAGAEVTLSGGDITATGGTQRGGLPAGVPRTGGAAIGGGGTTTADGLPEGGTLTLVGVAVEGLTPGAKPNAGFGGIHINHATELVPTGGRAAQYILDTAAASVWGHYEQVIGTNGVAVAPVSPAQVRFHVGDPDNPVNPPVIPPTTNLNRGPGLWDEDGWGIGAVRMPDDGLTYCVELPIPLDMDSDPAFTDVSTLPGFAVDNFRFRFTRYADVTAPDLLGEGLAQMNYIIERFGDTDDDVQAAAVAIAIIKLRLAGSSPSYEQLVNDVTSFVEGLPGGSGVNAQADGYLADAMANAHSTAVPSAPTLAVDSPGAQVGTITWEAGTTSLTLTNAIFESTGTNTLTITDGSAGSARWQAVPPAGTTGNYDIALAATYEVAQWPSTLQYAKTNRDNQGLATGTSATLTGEFDGQLTMPGPPEIADTGIDDQSGALLTACALAVLGAGLILIRRRIALGDAVR
ncbi:MAG: hypothetical protein ACK5KU_09170, partial [Beutenbergiaceae bacterium]